MGFEGRMVLSFIFSGFRVWGYFLRLGEGVEDLGRGVAIVKRSTENMGFYVCIIFYKCYKFK